MMQWTLCDRRVCVPFVALAIAVGCAQPSLSAQAEPSPQSSAQAADAKLLAFVKNWQEERYYALFRGDPSNADKPPERVGWSSFRYEVRTDQEPPLAVGIMRMRLSQDAMTRRDEVAYELIGTGRVLWVKSRLMSGDQVWVATMRRRLDGNMSQARQNGEHFGTRVVPHLSDSLDLQMLAHRSKQNRDFGWYREFVIDPFQDEPEKQRLEKASWQADTKAGRTYGTELFEEGKEYDVGYSAEGVRQSLVGKEWQSFLWPRASAQWFPNGGVPTYLELPEPANVARMTLVWRDCGVDSWLQTSTQSWTRRDDGALAIVLRRDEVVADAHAAPLAFHEQALYVLPEPLVPSGDPRIVSLARQLVGDERKVRRVAHKLVAGVRARLKWQETTRFRSAISVLDRGRGDCKDHAVLLIALARAVGVPARIVHGYAYGARVPPWGFNRHVWVQLHDGRQWLSVDAGHNQVLCAATYLASGYGFDHTIPMPKSRDLTIESFATKARRGAWLPWSRGK